MKKQYEILQLALVENSVKLSIDPIEVTYEGSEITEISQGGVIWDIDYHDTLALTANFFEPGVLGDLVSNYMNEKESLEALVKRINESDLDNSRKMRLRATLTMFVHTQPQLRQFCEAVKKTTE